MNPIQQECDELGITRLCHFTQSRNLAHILSDHYGGLYSTRTLKESNMPHNPNDVERYDGRDDLICCSIEYPNTYYLARAKSRERLFEDWVVLLIKSDHLWDDGTRFCPCNAAKSSGGHIKAGIEGFRSLYDEKPHGSKVIRSSSHLPAAPTDIQAEVLLEEPIDCEESITGIAVKSKEQAQQELFRLELQGIAMDKPIYIAPDLFAREKLPNLIRSREMATETLFKN